MKFETRPLTQSDVQAGVELDHQWFGDHGITKQQLELIIVERPNNTLALIGDNVFHGFATFELLEDTPPSDYVGDIPAVSKVLFIQQFTTTTNYAVSNMEMDQKLLSNVEKKAKDLNCNEVWEALSTTHPYGQDNNPAHDAFGFYESQGYTFDKQNIIYWQPNEDIKISCYLLRKKIK